MRSPVRRLAGGWLLLLLVLHGACVTSLPGGGTHGSASRGDSVMQVHALEFLEPVAGQTRPVPIERTEFQRALPRLVTALRMQGSPRAAAQALLSAVEEDFLAEVHAGQVLTLVPEKDGGVLTPRAEAALRVQYLGWCERRGGGDCLGLLEDVPYLRTDDRRALALALALGPVLDEAREALARQLLEPRAVVSLVVWTLGLYLALWLVPEPTTKALAATLTVILMSWLGADTLWGLMEGWARLAHRAEEATTFEQLREAGEQYAKVLGEDAARVLILGVAALTGRTLSEVAARVRTLPGHGAAAAQWEAQGGAAILAHARDGVLAEDALATALMAVEQVAASPARSLAVVMLKTGGGRAGAAPGSRGATTVLRHREGNRQVELGNGQRWHLPKDKSVADIPTEDKVGDRLQDAVNQAAGAWDPKYLSIKERSAIQNAETQGRYWLARLLEREARGRFVHAAVQRRFQGTLQWNHQGVDLVDLTTGRQYEVLSGTESNLARHGRRMAAELFRMIVY